MSWKSVAPALLFAILAVASSQATTVNKLEDQSGWHACSTCTKSTGTASSYTLTQWLSSPSQDGSSAKFHLGTTQSLADALWFKRVTNSSSATHFSYSVNYYYRHPEIPTGMEFSASERVGSKWYRWDWQCSYYYKVWRTWDNANSKWVNTTVPCNRPVAYSWTNAVFEGHRYNGKVYFDTVTVNGHKYYVNKTFYPKSLSYSSSGVSVHFQLNGNKAGTSFDVWGDRFSLNYW